MPYLRLFLVAVAGTGGCARRGLLRVVGLDYPKSGYANWFLRLRCVPGSGEAIAAALARRDDTA